MKSDAVYILDTLERQIHKFEKVVSDQFNVLKTILLDVEKKLIDHDKEIKRWRGGGAKSMYSRNKRKKDNKEMIAAIERRNKEIEAYNHTISKHGGSLEYR